MGVGTPMLQRGNLACHMLRMWAHPYCQMWKPKGPHPLSDSSLAIQSAAMGNQWSGPNKSFQDWFHWSAPLVSCSNWLNHKTESESRLGPLCAIHCGCGVTHNFLKGSIILLHAVLYGFDYSYRPVCWLPVCRLWMFGVFQFADGTYEQYSMSDSSEYWPLSLSGCSMVLGTTGIVEIVKV